MTINTLKATAPYLPTAIYYEDGDFLEYIREDIPSVDRRVDEYLTLVVDMFDRHPIGVKLKGFRYLYSRGVSQGYFRSNQDFISLTALVEKAMTTIVDSIFGEIERQRAYEQAIEIAKVDNVHVDRDQFAA